MKATGEPSTVATRMTAPANLSITLPLMMRRLLMLTSTPLWVASIQPTSRSLSKQQSFLVFGKERRLSAKPSPPRQGGNHSKKVTTLSFACKCSTHYCNNRGNRPIFGRHRPNKIGLSTQFLTCLSKMKKSAGFFGHFRETSSEHGLILGSTWPKMAPA